MEEKGSFEEQGENVIKTVSQKTGWVIRSFVTRSESVIKHFGKL